MPMKIIALVALAATQENFQLSDSGSVGLEEIPSMETVIEERDPNGTLVWDNDCFCWKPADDDTSILTPDIDWDITTPDEEEKPPVDPDFVIKEDIVEWVGIAATLLDVQFGYIGKSTNGGDYLVYMLAIIAYNWMNLADSYVELADTLGISQESLDGINKAIGLFIIPRLVLLSGIFSGRFHPFTVALVGVMIWRLIEDPNFSYNGFNAVYVFVADLTVTGMLNAGLYRVLAPFYAVVLFLLWLYFSDGDFLQMGSE